MRSLTTKQVGSIIYSCRIQTVTIDPHALERQPVSTSSEAPKFKYCEAPHGDDDLVHMVIVRGDLTIGQQFAQCIHATGESSPYRIPLNTVAVGLSCKDQPELLELHAKLEAANIPHALIRECDGEPMAIGIEPTRDRKALRKLTSSLPLVK